MMLENERKNGSDEDNGAIKRIPVVLDTDIGDDIDDLWALTMLIRNPYLDPKLIITSYGDVEYRAKVAAKLLNIAGRSDIPIALGKKTKSLKGAGSHSKWISDFSIKDYKGPIFKDGIKRLKELAEDTPEPITLISIGPLTTIGQFIKIYPELAEKLHFKGMHGSVFKGYNGSNEKSAEYNIKADIGAARQVFSASWASITITPLDTCGIVRLEGNDFRQLMTASQSDELLRELLTASRLWAEHNGSRLYSEQNPKTSTLFDTVAIYLAFSEDLVEIKELYLTIDRKGFMRIESENGKKKRLLGSTGKASPVRCAVEWKDLPGFKSLLIKNLTGKL